MKRTYDITDITGNKIGIFQFDPADPGLLKRIIALSEKIPDIIRPLRQVSISPDGTAAGPDARILRAAEQRLLSELDRAFGRGAAKSIFMKMRPFACVNGEFLCLCLIQLCHVAIEAIEKGWDRNERTG